MEYRLTTPCTAQDLAPLKAGDTVLLSGVVYTARDQAHKRMMEALDKGETLPFDLEGSAIYYVGPTPERPGEVIGSAGPTTSGRMDAMSPRLLDLGNKIMIGKGKRDAAVKAAVVRNGAVYLAALGGAGALMAKSVQTMEVIAWPDLGCEAVRRLTVQDMPDRCAGRPRRRSVRGRPCGLSGHTVRPKRRELHPLHKTGAVQNRQNSSSVQKNMVSLTKLAANYLHQPQKCDIL